MKKIFLLATFLYYNQIFAQIVAGPLLGYVEHREAAIWVEVDSKAGKVGVEYWPKSNSNNKTVIHYQGALKNKYNPLTIILPELQMNTIYQYQFEIDGKALFPSRVYEF